MFRGSTVVSLDGKGRLAIPAKYRDALEQRCGGRLVATLDPSSCVSLYPFPAWEEIEEKLGTLSSFNPIYAKLRRSLMGNAHDLEIDGAGRVLLPAGLRERAHLDKEVTLVGLISKFEVWNSTTWEASFSSPADVPAMLDELYKNGELPDELQGFSL